MSEKEALDRLLAGYPGEVAETARALRALIHRTLPVAEERVDAADHLIGFAFADPDGGKPAWDVLAVVPHSWHVNVQFGNGVDLADPGGLLHGSGKRARHATCRTPADAQRLELRDLILAQAEARGLVPHRGTSA